MSDTKDPGSAGWHLDRRVPLALIIAIFMQTVGGVWYAAGMANGIQNNKEDLAEIKQRADQRERTGDQVNERLIRLEQDVKHGNKLLEELVREQRRRQRQGTLKP